ncbi:MAG: hypothetical protein U1A72_23100 [Sulfuritalea sp.]|nr:hypothetical protein [Sulfuritalea sp.]
MRLAASLLIAATSLCLGACAAPPKSAAQSAAPQATDYNAESVAVRQLKRSPADSDQARRKSATKPAPPLVPQREARHEPEPDVVIKINPGSGGFSKEMEGRLAKIANEAKRDERILLRLESHVPDRGSPALNIGLAEKVLQKVKERLQELGVLSRRILLASFGGEHEKERDSRRHWVEIYLLRPGY